MNPILAAFVDEVTKLAGAAEKRWSEVIVESPNGSLTKRDVFNFYSEPKIRKAMLAEMKGRDVMVRQSFTPEFVVLKRKEGEKPIRIEQDKKDVNDPKDFSYFIERRVTEFHPTFQKNESRLLVDLDPRSSFPFEDTKRYAGEIAGLLKKLPGVKDTEIRYSGGRGFYVIGHLKKPMNVDAGRQLLKATLQPLTEDDDRLTLGVPDGDDKMRLDLSPLKEQGSVRGLYSLNASTGLVSVPVTDLDAFDPKIHATIDAVLGRKPKDYPHAR